MHLEDCVIILKCFVVETIKTEETVDITVKEDKGVSEAPRFTKTLHRQFEATEGSSVTIECEVTGKETPVVTWYQVKPLTRIANVAYFAYISSQDIFRLES